MNIKRAIFCCVFILLSTGCFLNAQIDHESDRGTYSRAALKKKVLQTETVTYVVLTGISTFDTQLKQGIKEYWKVNEYRFIDWSDFKDMSSGLRDQSNKLFLVNGSVTHGILEYDAWFLIAGEELQDRSGKKIKMIVTSITESSFNDWNFSDTEYRAKHIPKDIHDQLTARLQGKVRTKGRGEFGVFLLAKYRNKSNHLLAQKTLLVDSTQFGKIDQNTFGRYYSGKFKYVSTKEIADAIQRNDESCCYLLLIHYLFKHIQVVDCGSGSIIFEKVSTSGGSVTTHEIEKLNAVLGKKKPRPNN